MGGGEEGPSKEELLDVGGEMLSGMVAVSGGVDEAAVSPMAFLPASRVVERFESSRAADW